MKFAVFFHMPWPEESDPSRIFAETLEQVQYAEELGFYSAWFAEHHFSRYSMGSSSLVVASAAAAKTKTIRLATGVLVPTLHNPIRLAEDTATVDHISGGRLDVGFGRGFTGYEYGGFNIAAEDSQERFQECIRVIEGLWTTTEFSFSGNYYSVNKLNLVPPPVQKPHPPIYVGATSTRATLEYIISRGYTLCAAVVQDTAAALDLCRRFVKMSEESGSNIPMSDIPFFRYFYVAETAEQVRKDAEERLNWVLDILQYRGTFSESSEVPYNIEDWRKARSELPVSYDYLHDNRAFLGDPDSCIAKIQELRDQGIEYFGCNFAFGGMEHEKVMRSMGLFAREVMPRFV